MKRISAFVLVLMMAISWCSISSAEVAINTDSMFPIVDEPITMTMCMLRSASSAEKPEDLWFFRYYEKMTNVHWEIIEIDQAAWPDMKAIMFASDDYPDVFWGPGFTNAELLKYGQEGYFIDLKEYIDKYAVNMKKLFEVVPEAEVGMYAPDGKVYSMASFQPVPDGWYPNNCLGVAWINHEWMKNLNLKMPQTLKELSDVLLAFKEQDANGNGDPNDEIPWLSKKNTGGPEPLIMAAYGIVYPGSNYLGRRVETDEVVFLPYAEEYKHYLTYMNELYVNGIIDDSYFTMEGTQFDAAMIPAENNTYSAGLVLSPNAASWDEHRTFEHYECLSPMTSEINENVISPRGGRWNLGVMQVTDKCKYPEVAVRWQDIFYDPYNGFISQNGPEFNSEADLDGIGFDVNNLSVHSRPIGYYEANPENYGIWEYFCRYIGPRNKGNPWHTGLYDQYAKYMAYGPDAMARYENTPMEELTMNWFANMEYLKKYSTNPQTQYVEGYLSAEDNNTVTELWQPLIDHVESQAAQFITGRRSLDEYDVFLAEIEKLGANEINAIYHDTYEAAKLMSQK